MAEPPPRDDGLPRVEVLVPTCERPTTLAATLATLIGRTCRKFDVVVADPSDGEASFDTGETAAIARLLRARGKSVTLLRNVPRRGLAQQRQFLLDQSRGPLVQLRVMERFGGCGLLPSGAYHQELPTTIPNRDINAPEYLT